jgi:hypothetical protein
MVEFIALFPSFATQQDLIDSLTYELDTYTCGAGTGTACKAEAGYIEAEELLTDLVGDTKLFLKLRPYLDVSGEGGQGKSSGGKVAENVGGTGDAEQDVTLQGTPTGRISWIDLRL